MTKIDRQPKVAVSIPPTIGPADSALAPPAAHTPTARARSAGVAKVWLSRASEQGTRTAAPAPCTDRAISNTAKVGATPAQIEATVSTTNPATSARFAPIRSPRAPADMINAANTTV